MTMISMKQLRENFERVKEGLERGEEFLLVYRSKPLAEIKPATQQKTLGKTKKKEKLELTQKELRWLKTMSSLFSELSDEPDLYTREHGTAYEPEE